jgi:hypothetical protein
MWEIAENLHRAELTVLEYCEHVAEWLRLAEKKAKLAVSTCDSQIDSRGQKKSPQQLPSGVRAAARELGVDKDEAHRSVKVDSLSDEAKAYARENGLADNQSALLAAAKHDDPAAQAPTPRERPSKSAL